MTPPIHPGWSRAELAAGIPLGVEPSALQLPPVERSARTQIEHHITAALASGRQPYVCFSGGRDSSAVLALAAHVARRNGTELPVPITLRFPGHPETDERAWQELVVRHLGLTDWIVIDRPDADVLSSEITALLDEWGLFYPSQVGSYMPVLEAAAGGVVFSGEGGDESLGGWRFRAVHHPLAWGPREAFREAAVATLAHGPAPIRRWYVGRTGALPWLTPLGRAAVIGEMAKRSEAEPLAWSSYLAWAFARRSWHIARATLERIGERNHCRLVHPLADEHFLAALQHEWGWRGADDRTLAMQQLVGDLLPAAIVERDDKAVLAPLFIGDASRAFIEQWDADGLDDEFIDSDRLRAAWLRRYPYVGSLSLLHQAWLQRR